MHVQSDYIQSPLFTESRGPALHVRFSDNATDYVCRVERQKKNKPDLKIRLDFIYPTDFGIGYAVDNILMFLLQLPEIF
jgi:hypothetical protein